MPGPAPAASDHRVRRVLRATAIAALAWTALVLSSLAWNIHSERMGARALASHEAKVHFNKDQAFRFWASRHGGVYVATDDRTPPNPYLTRIPNRDITAPDGTALTLMNPAYMMRQMMDEYATLYGVRGRITSLKPLNPNNAADEWETRALLSFEHGVTEVFEEAEVAGRPVLRLMKPMMVQEGCLKCHEHQGYKVGDVRGGVGVAVDLEPYLAMARRRTLGQSASHGGIWLVGIAALAFVGRRARDRIAREVEEEREFRRLSHQNELILRSVGEGIYGLDTAGRSTFINPAASRMLGWQPEEFIGQQNHELIHHSRADGSPYPSGQCPAFRCMAEGVPLQSNSEMFWRKDGSCFPVELVAAPLVEDGGIRGAVVVFRDISERLATERRASDLLARLRQSNHDLQSFAYVVSHDLQEPLRMVSSYLGLIERRYEALLDADGKDFIGFAVDGAQRMARMITDLVELSRVETRGAAFADVDMGQVAQEAVANLRVAIAEAGAVVEIGDALPAVTGDHGQLVRVLQNLIANAVKFRHADRPPRVTLSSRPTGDGNWEFVVADNGIGIAAEDRERIFVIFQRVHGPERFEGTGIGLAIVKRIIDRHEGRIWVESEPGQGSAFHFTLGRAG